MSTEQAFRDYESRLTNPPVSELPGEACDRCGQEIMNDFAIRAKMTGSANGMWGLWCEDCAVLVERCDACGFLNCNCEDA